MHSEKLHKGIALSALLLVLGTLPLVSGCSVAVMKDLDSQYYRVPVGSLLTINQMIEIPRGTARVYIQHGEVSGKINQYDTNCNLRSRVVERDRRQKVEPGTYRVSHVGYEVELVRAEPVSQPSADMQVATIAEGGSVMVSEAYHLYLDGPDPNLERLTCRGAYTDQHQAQPPSINEIRKALGAVMTLTLAE